jgi:hypothetical protein
MELPEDADQESGEEITYGVAVLVCRDVTGKLYFDRFVDTTPIVGDKYKVAQVKDELLGTSEHSKECRAIAQQVEFLKLRSRYADNARGPWHFTAKVPLTEDLLLAVLNKYTEKDFDRLDKEARV